MATTLCILNHTDPDKRLIPNLGANAAAFDEIDSADDTPQSDSLILYIVGHGRSNALFAADGTIIDEQKVARAIRRRREDKPTLLIWDLCFASSFLKISGLDDWTPNFVHIFACRHFERTWHGPHQPNGPAVTLFSTALRDAVTALQSEKPEFDWKDLQRNLQTRFESTAGPWMIQGPTIDPLDSDHLPHVFQLGALIGEASQPLIDKRESDRIPAPIIEPENGKAAGAALHGGHLRGIQTARATAAQEARFGRLFGEELARRGDVAPTPEELGSPGGPMDGGDRPAVSTELFALLTYFGQFIDHDITFDPTSSLEQQQDADAIRNFRTPRLELDNLYGGGPVATPLFYDQSQPNKLLLGEEQVDVPRNHQGTAIIADPRDDANLMVSQLHLAFMKFHNAVVDRLDRIDDGFKDASPFDKAQRIVRWHYQWLVLNKFLPAIVGRETLADAMKERKLYRPVPEQPFIPVEFSVAAFRYGHSMVQPRYVINDEFRSALFSSTPLPILNRPLSPRIDLRGGPVRPEERINWKNFFDTGAQVSQGEGTTRFASKIDTQLSTPLLNLPQSNIPGNVRPGINSLAVLNLKRGLALGLPSGQAFAAKVQSLIPTLPVLDDGQLWGNPKATKFKGQPAPLWYYFLREAEVLGKGDRLGPIGGRLVAEVLLALLDTDTSSYRRAMPDWTPQLIGWDDVRAFGFRDFFRIAQVDFE